MLMGAIERWNWIETNYNHRLTKYIINMKSITKALKDLNTQYAELDKIKKFMSTPKGYQFAMRLGYEPIDQLVKRFQAPKTSVRDEQQRLNCYKYGATACKIMRRTIILKEYEKRLREAKKAGKLKLPKSLTKEEMYNIHHPLVRDTGGHPIQKTDHHGKFLWNAHTNIPIYRRRNRESVRMGLAEKCHLYELHKMAKWDAKHPVPTSVELAFTLFPEETMASYKTRRSIALEHIRNVLSEKYYHCKPISTPNIRMYSVHKVDGYSGTKVIFEKECDPYIYGYPFAGYVANYPSKEFIEKKLQLALKNAQKGESIIGFRVYDKFGALRGQMAAQR